MGKSAHNRPAAATTPPITIHEQGNALPSPPPPYTATPSSGSPIADDQISLNSVKAPNKSTKAWTVVKTAVNNGKAKDVAIAAYQGGLAAKKAWEEQQKLEVSRGGNKGNDEALKIAKAAIKGGVEAKKTWEIRKEKREAKMAQDMMAGLSLEEPQRTKEGSDSRKRMKGEKKKDKKK